MAKPTVLSPWFVIMRVRSDGTLSGDYLPPEWYTDDTDGGPAWSDPENARLFNSIHSVTRVARAVGGYAVVVSDEETLKEFRPKGL